MKLLEPGARPAHRLRDRADRLGLADHAPAQVLLHLQEARAFRLQQLAHGHAGPLRDHLRDLVRAHHGVRALLELAAGAGLVQQVDRLIRQEAVLDVLLRQLRGGHDCLVADAHAVVRLVGGLQATQDRDRGLDCGLGDQDRLEAPLERGILLDVLAVLLQRGGADALELAAGQDRLEHVRGVQRGAFRGARADHRMQLVDEQDHPAAQLLDLA
jgi:hypothetical protein